MLNSNRRLNLVLSGGGVKGIAYAGVFSAAEKAGYNWDNIAGVSAGGLVGALSSAGYNAQEIWNILDKFDFEKIKVEEIPKKVPVVSNYIDYSSSTTVYIKSYSHFLEQNADIVRNINSYPAFSGFRGNLLKNIIGFSKDGCLYDGDYLEEWISKELIKKGIKYFGDLKDGLKDKSNPMGYRIRMTAVDANRGRIIVLPDDISFYDIKPDKLEVAKAIRMTTSVPFAFKPVELKKKEGNIISTYHIIDGGVFDNFPCWLISNSSNSHTIGFRLNGGEKKKLFSVDTPLNIIKGLISAVHDIGLPKYKNTCSIVSEIDTTKVPYLDFNLLQQDKEYLFKAGENSALKLFSKLDLNYTSKNKRILRLISKQLRSFRLYRNKPKM